MIYSNLNLRKITLAFEGGSGGSGRASWEPAAGVQQGTDIGRRAQGSGEGWLCLHLGGKWLCS